MKIVALSDLHGYLPKVKDLPEADVMCICGDIVPLEYQHSMAKSVAWFCLEFVPWADSLPYKKVIFIGGNHDFFLYNISFSKNLNECFVDAAHVMSTLLPGANKSKHKKLVYLFDNSYTFNGVKFYGTPWIASLTNWAFYKNEEDLEKAYNNIPKKVDVLITHMPSATAYTDDVLQHGCFNTMTSYGSYQLSNAILGRKIKWAICGHVHSGNHRPENVNGTNFVNVSIKDEDYKVSYEPFVFEV